MNKISYKRKYRIISNESECEKIDISAVSSYVGFCGATTAYDLFYSLNMKLITE